MGVEQNSPISTPGVANLCLAGGDGEIATRHQLTAGGGRHTLHGRDYRLGQIHDPLHHIAARRHDVMEIGSAGIRVAAAAGEFLKVMPGAERGSIGSKHDRSNSVVGCDVTQRAGQRNQHRF